MPTYTPRAPEAFKEPLCPYEPHVRPFNFYTQPSPATILLRNGRYIRVYEPAWEEVEILTEGVTYFSEGRDYEIDDATAAALTADGFGEDIS